MKRRAQRGQALVLVAVVLPVLTALLLGALDVALRWLDLARVEDALRQAARSGALEFRYAPLAANRVTLDEPRVIAAAEGTLVTNLTGIISLAETPAATAARLELTLLPAGGSCPQAVGASQGPTLCAALRPRLTGPLGIGYWEPQVVAAEAIDIAQE